MAGKCTGICGFKYEVKKKGNGGAYNKGYKWCKNCIVFIKWDGIFCPCCRMKMRVGVRNKNKAEDSKVIEMRKRIE